jgi:hypothetical protein
MIRKVMLSILTVAAMSIAPAMYGQAAQQDKQPQGQADRSSSGEQTLTGCLTEQQGSYMLATQTGEQVTVSGSGDLSKHKDHTVRLTGKKSDDAGKATMTVSKIEHVSASCSK